MYVQYLCMVCMYVLYNTNIPMDLGFGFVGFFGLVGTSDFFGCCIYIWQYICIFATYYLSVKLGIHSIY